MTGLEAFFWIVAVGAVLVGGPCFINRFERRRPFDPSNDSTDGITYGDSRTATLVNNLIHGGENAL